MSNTPVDQQENMENVVETPASPNGGAGASAGQFSATSLYVGDLDVNVTEMQLYNLFSQVGQVASLRVCRDRATLRSLGYGYVNYMNAQGAARALEVLNFTMLNKKPIRIMYCNRDPTVRRTGAANVFVKNLDVSIDNRGLYDTFRTFGNILSCKIATYANGQSKGHGFVQFEDEEAAQSAIDKLNGMLLNDKQVYVGRFVRKQERETGTGRTTRFTNLYVKNLAASTTDEDLKNIFGEYGTITSSVVIRADDGKPKGFGFVNFENADDAARAVEALNRKKFEDGKEWYVGRAQTKLEREQELAKRKEEARALLLSRRTAAPRMHRPSSASQPLFFGQGPPAMMPPQARFGYQQQLVPGMHPGGSPLPNFMPMLQQGQPHGGRRRGAPMQQTHQPVPMMQQQMMQRGPMFRFPPGHNVPMNAGGMFPFPNDMGGMLPPPAVPHPTSVAALKSALANATPEQQILGQNLYPLIGQLEHEQASKAIAMLMNMDQTEVLRLLESPDALKAKVNEALEELSAQSNNPTDQLASLSLNDN